MLLMSSVSSFSSSTHLVDDEAPVILEKPIINPNTPSTTTTTEMGPEPDTTQEVFGSSSSALAVTAHLGHYPVNVALGLDDPPWSISELPLVSGSLDVSHEASERVRRPSRRPGGCLSKPPPYASLAVKPSVNGGSKRSCPHPCPCQVHYCFHH